MKYLNVILPCLNLDSLVTQNLRMKKREEQVVHYYSDCELLTKLCLLVGKLHRINSIFPSNFYGIVFYLPTVSFFF